MPRRPLPPRGPSRPSRLLLDRFVVRGARGRDPWEAIRPGLAEAFGLLGDGADREAGADGLLLTDLPAGADPALEARLLPAAGGMDLIRLLAPTTTPDRAVEVADGGTGFLYYISRTGVTGAREELRSGLEREVGALRELTDLPIAVGFGISTPGQAATVARIADGVVVGSALIEVSRRDGVEEAGRFLASLRGAMDGTAG